MLSQSSATFSVAAKTHRRLHRRHAHRKKMMEVAAPDRPNFFWSQTKIDEALPVFRMQVRLAHALGDDELLHVKSAVLFGDVLTGQHERHADAELIFRKLRQ